MQEVKSSLRLKKRHQSHVIDSPIEAEKRGDQGRGPRPRPRPSNKKDSQIMVRRTTI